MTEIFFDSSAFFALVDPHDPSHSSCQYFLKNNKVPFVTTNFIFSETLSLLTKRLGKPLAIQTGTFIKQSGRVRLVSLSDEHQEQAWKMFQSFSDKEYDYIDCTCFIFMDSMNIRSAFSVDRHFTQYGFRAYPER